MDQFATHGFDGSYGRANYAGSRRFAGRSSDGDSGCRSHASGTQFPAKFYLFDYLCSVGSSLWLSERFLSQSTGRRSNRLGGLIDFWGSESVWKKDGLEVGWVLQIPDLGQNHSYFFDHS